MGRRHGAALRHEGTRVKERFYVLKQWGGLILSSELSWFDTMRQAEAYIATQPMPTGDDGCEYAMFGPQGQLLEGYAPYNNMLPWGWTYCDSCLQFFPDLIPLGNGEHICEECMSKHTTKTKPAITRPYCYAVEVWDNDVPSANLLVFEDDPNCVRRNTYIEQREDDPDYKYYTFEDAARLRDAFTPQPVPQDIRIAVEVTASVDALTAAEAESRLIEALVEAKGDSVDIKHVGKRNF